MPTPNEYAWYKWFPAKALTSVRWVRMTLEQEGFYRRMYDWASLSQPGDKRGYMYENGRPMSEELIANCLRTPVDVCRNLLVSLAELGLISRNQAGAWGFPTFAKHQHDSNLRPRRAKRQYSHTTRELPASCPEVTRELPVRYPTDADADADADNTPLPPAGGVVDEPVQPHESDPADRQVAYWAGVLHRRVVEVCQFSADGNGKGPRLEQLTGMLREQVGQGYTLADVERCCRRGGVNANECVQWNRAGPAIAEWFRVKCQKIVMPKRILP